MSYHVATNRAFFIDTWGWAALGNDRDGAHREAAGAWERLLHARFTGVTTDWIVDETVTLLHARAGFRAASKMLDTIDALAGGDVIRFVHVDEELFRAAKAVFAKRGADTPRLSLTDCTSFAVMEALGVEAAFTADAHFKKAGKHVQVLFERQGDGHAFTPPPF